MLDGLGIIPPQPEGSAQLTESVARIEYRFRLANEMADEEITLRGIGKELRPSIEKRREIVPGQVSRFAVRDHQQQIRVGPARVVPSRPTAEQQDCGHICITRESFGQRGPTYNLALPHPASAARLSAWIDISRAATRAASTAVRFRSTSCCFSGASLPGSTSRLFAAII